MKTIKVVGKRWFQKSYGNTYHSVRVFVDGVEVGFIPFRYGYENHYLQTAHELLTKEGYLPQESTADSLDRYCYEQNIQLIRDVKDVNKKALLA